MRRRRRQCRLFLPARFRLHTRAVLHYAMLFYLPAIYVFYFS